MKKIAKLFVLVLLVVLAAPAHAKSPDARPHSFVVVNDMIPSAVIDMRYYGADNFVGARVDGYEAPLCILTDKASVALKAVSEEMAPFGLRLRIFDCFRPQKAVDHFARWAEDIKDVKTKKKYYPNVDKRDLFKDGYIAHKSGHSRGSTVDLTIDGLDMGSPFDFFGDISATEFARISGKARINRLLLKEVMGRFGFVNYDKEWWHYTLKDEPYKKKYFNFDVR